MLSSIKKILALIESILVHRQEYDIQQLIDQVRKLINPTILFAKATSQFSVQDPDLKVMSCINKLLDQEINRVSALWKQPELIIKFFFFCIQTG